MSDPAPSTTCRMWTRSPHGLSHLQRPRAVSRVSARPCDGADSTVEEARMNYDDLDPGIRDTVRRLRDAGFEDDRFR